MAIKPRNKKKLDFNMSSMSDLVFLLLIFFMLTSTLVSPNAIKLLLPNSSSKTLAKQTVNVYINANLEYFIEREPVAVEQLENSISEDIKGQEQASIVLRSDKSVPIQNVVNVIDAVNKINEKNNTKHKVILATKPNK
jgi:biopolymer transport protein ExbD